MGFTMLGPCIQVKIDHFRIKITHPGQLKVLVLGFVF